jgi:4-hydroxy-tetrahydrodipicolinate reductase
MKIGIVGCCGRMGQMLVEAVLTTSGVELSGGVERPGSSFVGQSISSRSALLVSDDAKNLFAISDAVIDFTHPTGTVLHAQWAAQAKCALVVGTTGLSADDEAILAQSAQQCPIVYAANYSIGVALLSALVERAAAVLGDSYDIEIVEMHHRNKVDAPSGTALSLGRAAAQGRKVELDQVWCKSRDGQTGARPKGEIGFATLRGGDVVGDHTVIFAGAGERLELTHKATNRNVFAAGAVQAALWAHRQKPGLYSIVDVVAD